jgi:hypothetical protein
MIKTGKSMGIELDYYNEKYSIVQGYEGKDGSFKPEGVRKSKWDKDANGPVLDEKNQTLKIYLGPKEQAIQVLTALLSEITGEAIPF